MDKVIVVTAVHNRYEATENFVKSIKAQTYRNWSLLLVDDGSTDGTAKMVMRHIPGVEILYGNGELWWGGAMQLAYQSLTTKAEDNNIVFIANDDISIPKDFIENAVGILQQNVHSLLSATGINIDNGHVGDSPIKYNFARFTSKAEVYDGTANCASTRAVFIRIKDLKSTGGFRPKLLPHYGSDYEFTIRSNRRGVNIIGNRELIYTYSDKTSGNHSYIEETPITLFRRIFSKKSAYNPFYGLIYEVLITPFYLLPIAVCYKLFRYIRNLFKYFVKRMHRGS